MNYEEFKMKVLEGLQEFYKDEAEIEICEVIKNNGKSYDGIRIKRKKFQCQTIPIIEMDSFYRDYCNGENDIARSVKEIVEKRNSHVCPEEMEQFASKITDWEYVKENVYPALLSTKENQQLLENLVSVPLLDLSVIYIIRDDLSEGCRSSAKITKKMLEYCGVSKEQLHSHAIENLNKDGYEFQDIKALLKGLYYEAENEEEMETGMEMFVLTNASKVYGAAGILSKQLLKNFAGNRDFFILPSSVHEWIFVPAVDKVAKQTFDNMVKEVNSEQVDVEERLSDHCYYYDAKENEVRMCA
ncbi:MAG: DUF5688 family protein [Lachnospiraceae bacterium]|nr:DUF5688 family protein [Lachnospiraceae bacterium]